MKGCMKAPDGQKVMHAKDLCHLVSDKSFNKTAECIKKLIMTDVTKKIMPPPMDCVGGIPKYCVPKNHPIMLGWVDMFMVDMLKTKTSPKKLKDKFNSFIEAEWNIFAAMKRFYDAKCKAERKFTDKYSMISG